MDTPDNWWDLNHNNDQSINLLKHFTDKELQSELDRRQSERRKLEIMAIVGGREAIGFFDMAGSTEHNAEWELHIVFSNGTKHCFNFSSAVGQTTKTMDDFRMIYFPHLPRIDYEDYKELASAQKVRKKKKKVCHVP